MTKIVYNATYGGFGLSDAAIRRYAELKGWALWVDPGKFGLDIYWKVPPEERPVEPEPWGSAPLAERQAYNKDYDTKTLTDRTIPRTDLDLVKVVEELGKAANARFAELRIAEVPAGSHYRIDEYDGLEGVMTPEDYNWSTA